MLSFFADAQFTGGNGKGELMMTLTNVALADVPLPVELISFSGTCADGKYPLLTWTTASEHNSSYFQIERSKDGFTWEVIGVKTAAGFSNELLTYTWVVEEPQRSDNYYRITLFDVDGTQKSFEMLFISCEDLNENKLSSFPNPSNSGFQIILNSSSIRGVVSISVTDVQGKKLFNEFVSIDKGTNMFWINEGFSPGMYYISVRDNGNVLLKTKHLVE